MNAMDVPVSAPAPIDKMLVVGHPVSGYESVCDLLNAAGMGSPKPSKREGMTPREITQTLLKAHGKRGSAVGAETVQSPVSPVWNGLVLDLMLGNIDQKMWCWADSEAVSLLEYWKSLDSRLGFVLVYDTPHQFIARTFGGSETVTSDALESKLREWSAYNRALLRFHLRNRERSLLVHSSQIRANGATYLDYMRRQMGLPLLTDAAVSVPVENPRENGAPDEALYVYLAGEFLHHYPDVVALYEELQSVANIALPETQSFSFQAREAWSAAVRMKHDAAGKVQQLEDKLALLQEEKHGISERLRHCSSIRDAISQEKGLLSTQLREVQETLEREKEHLSGTVAEQEALLEEREARIDTLEKALENAEKSPPSEALEKENRVLLEQLHEVQEAFERYYLRTQKPGKKRGQTSTRCGAAERIKRQLSYRLGATMVHRSRSFSGWVTMPAALLRETRQFRRELAERAGEKLPPISSYADAHEAERVKGHLSYRLGKAMLENARSPIGWARLPMALRRAVKEYRQSRADG